MAQRDLPTNLKIAREVIAANRERPANLAALLRASDALYPFPRVAHLSELLQHWWNANEASTACAPRLKWPSHARKGRSTAQSPGR